ncbi:restriction endonuclease [Methylocystis sp. SB2]|uniref:restriction endonuclease n=1 Tax=Methylocystis sp. (strain SB2) TaxID=743836 RepID=UPI0009F92E86|nr:restriction endonuclease [Methylocystis sp. SB2]
MAKKKKNDGSGLVLLPFAGLLAWAGWPSDLSKIIAGLLAIAGLGIIAVWITEHVKYSRAVRRVDSKLEEVVESNIEALARRRSQLLQLDPYGNLKPEKWLKEIGYFISKNLFSALNSDYDRFVAAGRAPELTDYVESTVAAKTELEPRHQAFRDEMTPIEYEHYCAEELKRSGWDARVTTASRDQGVDVIAQKSGIRLAVQCKLYRSPVGNKAVQEVVAARAHEAAAYGIVVSNNSYTPSAQELARTNNVILLHHRDLAKIDKILSFPKKASERVFVHPESSSEEVPREAALEATRPLQSLTILFYTMAALVSVMIISIFLTRAPQNKMSSRSVQDPKHTAQKTQASSGTSTPSASSRGTSSISDVTAKDPSSPSEVTAQTLSRSSQDPKAAPSATPRGNVETAVEDGHKVSRTQTSAADNPLSNSALALRCLPAPAGDTTSIDISITGDKWTVRHRQKKGAAIERRAQYDILDTSRERELSWQGVHRRNRDLKMVASLSHRSPNGTRIYKEELIDANVGRVMEMTAVCEELRAWPTPPRRGH